MLKIHILWGGVYICWQEFQQKLNKSKNISDLTSSTAVCLWRIYINFFLCLFGFHIAITSEAIWRHLGSDLTKKSFPDLPDTQWTLNLNYDDVVVAFSHKLGRKCTIPSESSTQDSYKFKFKTITMTTTMDILTHWMRLKIKIIITLCIIIIEVQIFFLMKGKHLFHAML